MAYNKLPLPKRIKVVRHVSPFLESGIRIFVIAMLVVICFGNDLMAEQYPVLYRGIRPLGMGGAFTAVADDENALFYNPAGLSTIYETGGTSVVIPLPLLDVSKNSIDLYNDADDIDMDDTGEVADLLRKYVGEHQHLRAAFFPSFGFEMGTCGVLIGALAQQTADAEIHNPAWPEAHLDMNGDVGLLVGAGIKAPLTGLRAGATIKFLARESLDEIYTATDIAASDFEDRLRDDMQSGNGVSADIGLLYSLDYVPVIDTQLGLVVQNIPEMTMGKAKDIKTQTNAGIAFKKSLSSFTIVATLDYLDIGNAIDEDDDIPKKLHLGAEIRHPRYGALRAGLNQGYFTAGATFAFGCVRLDVATYAEEVGAYAGQREDRRYAGQIGFVW
jgi:hypothetical protein